MKLLRARTPAQALTMLAEHPSALPIAGGTDFMVSWNMGLLNDMTVIDLSPVREWNRIERTKDGLRIRALTPHAAVREHPVVRRRFPLLAQACAQVGSEQIQNRGTLGGNIANASPAGDTFPALAVYEASVSLESRDGRRRLPFLKVFAGVKKTVLGPGELIEAVELPFPPSRPDRQVFRKVGTRAAQAISRTAAAGLLWLGRGGRVERMRFALGSMAPTVRRLAAAEDRVAGERLSPEVIEEAVELVSRDVSPIDDIRSTAEYRLRVSRNILRGFLGRT